MIEGVKVISLETHVDDRGYLIETLWASDEHPPGSLEMTFPMAIN